MKKIFFVLGGMSRGGAERVISILANRCAQDNWDVSVLMLLTNRCEYPLNPAIKLIDLTGGGGSRMKKAPYWIRELRALMRLEKPDVVVSFVARINLLTLFAARGLQQRVIISERNDPTMDGRSVLVKFATNLLYSKADGIVFQTERAKNYFKKRIAEKSVVIGNPVQVSIQAKSEKQNKIVTAGRLMAQKNHKMLIDAFSRVHQDFPACRLYIYGEGDLRCKLEKQIRELGLEGYVFLPGNMADIHERISDAKLFVLSSDYEGQSNALLEAMAMGLPVISTDCAGSDEVIRDGENGLLVPVGDTDAMAVSIEKLLGNDELCAIMGAQAKKDVKKFDAGYILRRWCDLLIGSDKIETERETNETRDSHQTDRDAAAAGQMVGKN
ncbi:MAG TPA: glycosyltransferase family 4 protein [Oscillospiraceae bacterium]|nr:glycosyltransferase family 4 protein [Oscillospiraceae bacterium]HPF55331.1 glycosyltransferase family 4 protein [Clostridiales bacterium]HPK36085.1 glycosyltransferase family 4 protein [Oscillospiraceae bacterium]HPR76496.1 glycosyltransferase family 4 protein [Oscillospiraceae bacterium]